MLLAVQVNQHVWWYLARASGLVSWLLVSSTVLWGLVVSGRLTRKRPPPAWNLDLHRFLGGLAVTFTALHLVGLALDHYVYFGPSELFIPLQSSWRSGAVAWGIVGLYLLLAIELTSLMMKRLPRRLWRSVHASSFALWGLATLHGLQAGSDTGNFLMRDTAIVLIVAGIALTILRITLPSLRRRHRADRPTAAPQTPQLEGARGH